MTQPMLLSVESKHRGVVDSLRFLKLLACDSVFDAMGKATVFFQEIEGRGDVVEKVRIEAWNGSSVSG